MSRPKLGIILPGKIGDIAICLPIAKYYYDKGYDIFWPLYDYVVSHYKDYVDYVNFFPVSDTENCIIESQSILASQKCEKVIDLSFTNKGCWGNENSQGYKWQNLRSFDEYRYYIANVPFEEKWKLHFDRFPNRLTAEGKYSVVNLYGSDCNRLDLEINFKDYDGDVITTSNVTDSVLDWVPIFKKADKLVLIDSCFSTLVEQLGIVTNKQHLVLRTNYYGDKLQDGRYKGLSLYRGPWHIIE